MIWFEIFLFDEDGDCIDTTLNMVYKKNSNFEILNQIIFITYHPSFKCMQYIIILDLNTF